MARFTFKDAIYEKNQPGHFAPLPGIKKYTLIYAKLLHVRLYRPVLMLSFCPLFVSQLSASRGRASCLPKNVSRRLGASKRQNAPKTKDEERLKLDCNHPPIEATKLKPRLHVTE